MRTQQRLPALFALGLALGALPFGAHAQEWIPVVNNTDHTGVATDGWGGHSGASAASGSFNMRLPAGAVVRSAHLVSFFHASLLFAAGSAPSVMLPAGVTVRVGGAPVVNLASRPVRSSCYEAPLALYENCFGVTVTDLTPDLALLLPPVSPTAETFSIPVIETGDGAVILPGLNFSVQGHQLVLTYDLPGALHRYVGLFVGPVTRGDNAGEARAEPTILPSERVPPPALCSDETHRHEFAVLSVSLASSFDNCGEANTVAWNDGSVLTSLNTHAGGGDDGDGANMGCAGTDNALLTTGSFGATSMGAVPGGAVGTDGDTLALGATGSRLDDELYGQNRVPTGLSMVFDTRVLAALGAAVVQYPVNGDNDSDNFADLTEGYCTAVDTDNDGTEDWRDTDSDNDCTPDSAESSTGRTDPGVPLANPSTACTNGACDTARGQCIPCAEDCGSSTRGSVCLLLGSAGLMARCGCTTSADCHAPGVCTGNICGPAPLDAGPEASTDARESEVRADNGIDEVRDGGPLDAAQERREDGSVAGDAAPAGPTHAYSGGACTCRTGPRGGAPSRGVWAVLAATAAAGLARRRRRLS